jgi:peptidyl-prolyl cis-trans isomerase C
MAWATWATARHILVATEKECNALKTQIENGESFESVAVENSKCPSGRKGGDLGRFGPGEMVPEFDQAVFGGSVGVLYGPIKTQFGYHLLEVTARG